MITSYKDHKLLANELERIRMLAVRCKTYAEFIEEGCEKGQITDPDNIAYPSSKIIQDESTEIIRTIDHELPI